MLFQSNALTLIVLVAGSISEQTDAHGHHHHHHEHDVDAIDGSDGSPHSHLRRLGLFSSSSATDATTSSVNPCLAGDKSYTIGGVKYKCEKEFQQMGGNCRTPDQTKEKKAKSDEDFKLWEEIKANKGQKKKNDDARHRNLGGCGSCVDWDTQVITVPTYFHVIHSGTTGRQFTYDGYDESNPAYIQNQIKVMNKGFRGEGQNSGYPLNGNILSKGRSTTPYASDTKIQFCLLGTTATDNSNWYNDNDVNGMKSNLDVGGMESLNVYVSTAGGYLGYAYFPTSNDSVYDGIVLLNDSMPGGNAGIYSEGDTVRHAYICASS